MAIDRNISFNELQQLAEGKLTEPRKSEVENAIANDLNLKNTFDGIVAYLENEKQPISNFIQQGQKKVTEKLNQTSIKREQKPKFNWYYAVGIAASVLALVMLFYPQKPNPSDFDFTDAGLPVTLGVDASEMGKAMNAYKLEEYNSAKVILENQLTENPENDTLMYYLGVIAKEQKDFEKAITLFNKLPNGSKFYPKAEYQLGLCHWYLGEADKAKSYFTGVASNEQHLFYQKAKTALKEFN